MHALHGLFHRLWLVCVFLVCSMAHTNAQLGENSLTDAALHFSISAGISFVSCRLITKEYPDMRLGNKYALAAGIGLTVGVGKEFFDMASGKYFDFYDIGFDVCGISTGILLHYLIFDKKAIHSNLSLNLSDRQYGVTYRWNF